MPIPDISDHQPYPLRLAVKCRRIEPRHFTLERVVSGESLNISSKNMLFTSTEAFLPGQVVEALIDWPILLDNRIRLILAVEGVVVKTTADNATMRIQRHEFRTSGVATTEQARVMRAGALT